MIQINSMDGEKTGTITLYHATKKANVFSIIKEGLKAGVDNMVYFCKTEEDALRYVFMYDKTRHEVAVIPVKFSKEEFLKMELNYDNAPGDTPDAYAHEGSIPASRIPTLLEIKLYVIGEN